MATSPEVAPLAAPGPGRPTRPVKPHRPAPRPSSASPWRSRTPPGSSMGRRERAITTSRGRPGGRPPTSHPRSASAWRMHPARHRYPVNRRTRPCEGPPVASPPPTRSSLRHDARVSPGRGTGLAAHASMLTTAILLHPDCIGSSYKHLPEQSRSVEGDPRGRTTRSVGSQRSRSQRSERDWRIDYAKGHHGSKEKFRAAEAR